MTISEKIYQMRTSRNMSLRDFANLVGVTHTTIARIENDKNGNQDYFIGTLIKICKSLEYNFETFLVETGCLSKDAEVIFSNSSSKKLLPLTNEQLLTLKKIYEAKFFASNFDKDELDPDEPIEKKYENEILKFLLVKKFIEQGADVDVPKEYRKNGFRVYYQISQLGLCYKASKATEDIQEFYPLNTKYGFLTPLGKNKVDEFIDILLATEIYNNKSFIKQYPHAKRHVQFAAANGDDSNLSEAKALFDGAVDKSDDN